MISCLQAEILNIEPDCMTLPEHLVRSKVKFPIPQLLFSTLRMKLSTSMMDSCRRALCSLSSKKYQKTNNFLFFSGNISYLISHISHLTSPITDLIPPISLYNHNRNIHIMPDCIYRGAKNQITDSLVPMSTHHQQVHVSHFHQF